MFINAYIFVGSSNFLSLETMNPKIIPKNTMKMHFSRSKLIRYSLHLKKHSFSLDRCVSISL
jgi:hypothetical protein